jgi:hypothetical protein
VLVDSKATVIKQFPTAADKNGSQFWTQAAPNFFGGFQILKNGNIVVANWEGHGGGNGGKGFQLIEIDSSLTKVVSYWKQDASLVSSLHGVLVLDSLDTKNMYSDVGGVLTPVIPSSVRYGMQHTPSILSESFSVPLEKINRVFGLDGRLTATFSNQRVPAIYVRPNGTLHGIDNLLSK